MTIERTLPPLHQAAHTGDLAAMERLLAAGAGIEDRVDVMADHGVFWRGLTSLMVAAFSSGGASEATVAWLLQHGADLHAVSAGGVTAAWYAASAGSPWSPVFAEVSGRETVDHAARLARLLDAGLDPDESASNGRSLLVEACRTGDPERVRLLLQRGARLAPVVDLEAARRQRARQVGQLMEQLDLDEAEVVRLLPQWNEAPAAYQIPLFVAAESGSDQCVALLLDAGADAGARDDQLQTPLMLARNPATLKVLLRAGARATDVDNMGRDVLQHVLGLEGTGVDEQTVQQMVQLLLAAGLDIHAELKHPGWTRLYDAAFSQDGKAVARLLKSGADPRRGRPPLNGICWHSNREYSDELAEMIRRLVDAGDDVNARDAGGDTLLHCAASPYAHAPDAAHFNRSSDGSNLTAVTCLLRHGADPDPVGTWEETPLMLAAADGATGAVQALLDASADPGRQNADGDSAVDRARKVAKRRRRALESADRSDERLVNWLENALREAESCHQILQEAVA